MSDAIDVNPGQSSGGDASSAFQAALESHSETQVSKQPSETPSADSLNTVKAQDGVSQDENLPFGKHPRWQQVLKERDESKRERDEVKKQYEAASKQAQYGQVWQDALSQHPEFAKELISLVDKFQKGPQQASGDNAQSLEEHPDPLVRQMAAEIKNLKQQYDDGSKYLTNERTEKTVSKYKSDFKDLVKDLTVPEHYQKKFEKGVFERLQALSPDSVANFDYDQQSFKQAVQEEIEEFNNLQNGIISSYTSSKLNQAVPKTQSGGISPLSVPQRTDDEELNDLVGQLRTLKGR